MKLPIPPRDVQRDLREFDIWITPSLGEITETSKFKAELARIITIFNVLGSATGNFADERHCQPAAIAQTFAQLATGKPSEERAELFKSLASTLFLVTGKSDNNAKCQFPLFLRDAARWDTLPSISTRRGVKHLPHSSIPRVIKSDDFMELIAQLDTNADESRLLEQFISFLLKDADAVRQFWTLGHSYYSLKQFNKGYESNLLAPIVVFKVRGSVSASGGHKPEALLRTELVNWGLVPEEDFNLNDVIVDGNEDGADEKTRAYDFVLPHKTQGWTEAVRILMQSQFYAGDSGSVSHKNVDQTLTSRARVLRKYPSIRFLEYVDGAGYFSSLNGDLRRLLSMDTTHSFIQIRTASTRLRRELQAIQFLTPLEVEHAVARSSGDEAQTKNLLISEGYPEKEIARSMQQAKKAQLIKEKDSGLSLADDRHDIVRQYLLLDVLAASGNQIEIAGQQSSANVLIGGYGPFYGLEIDALVNAALQTGAFPQEFSNSATFAADIKALSKRGLIMMR